MPTFTAIKNGNFNDSTVWDLGTVPGSGDVAMPATFTVTITASIDLSPGGRLDGTGHTGFFQVTASGRTVRADVVSDLSNVFRFSAASPATCLLIGNATAGSGSSVFGARNESSGTLNITGNATGGGGTNAHGALNLSTGTMNISGNATGGSGSNALGAQNIGGGTLRVTRAIGNLFGVGGAHSNFNAGVAGSNTAGTVTTVEQIEYGAFGQSPTLQNVTLLDKTTNAAQFRLTPNGARKTLVVCDYPTAANVLQGVNYDWGNRVGTVVLPAVTNVRSGVAYRNNDLTGTLVLPVEADVRLNVVYDNADKLGKIVLPVETDVRLNVVYDNADKLGKIVLPVETDVRVGVVYDNDDKIGVADVAVWPPIAPSGLTATAVSQTAIDLEWTNNDASTIIRIECSPDGAWWMHIASVEPDETQYADSDLRAATQYFYRVGAQNEGGVSYSNVVSVSTLSYISPLFVVELESKIS